MKRNCFLRLVYGVMASALIAVSNLNAGVADITVPVGTLPANKSVAITYSLTINGTLPTGVGSITNQANVSGSNFTTVQTDDPTTGAPNDATVTLVSVPPVLSDVSKTVAEDTTLTFASGDFTAQFNDSNGDTLQNVIVVSLPSNGSLELGGVTVTANQSIPQANLGTLTYLASTNYNGSDSFQWTATDSNSTAAETTNAVNLTITEVNDPPVASDDTLSSVAEDSGARTIPFTDLTGNDSPGPANENTQTLTVTGVANAIGGSVQIAGTDVIFTPTANFNGTASFDYTVQDNGTTASVADPLTDGGAVSFSITPVADTPSITSATTTEGQQTTSGLAITANAGDGAEVTHFKITGIQNGTLYQNDGTTMIANGSFITVAEGGAGLKFTPTSGLFSPVTTFSFDAQSSTSNSDAGLGGGVATGNITVNPLHDFADAPSPYPVLLADNGARHVVPSAGATLYLGAAITDIEADGLPESSALGDDNDATDDEDGVVLPSAFLATVSSNVTVTASASGVLNAWIDFNDDGDWSDDGEQVFTNVTLSAGANVLAVMAPASTVDGTTFARFRFSTQNDLAVTGQASDGEVEDYSVVISSTTPPSVTCPSDVVTTNVVGQCQSELLVFEATAGGVPAPTVTYMLNASTITSPYAFPVGTNVVTVSAVNGVSPDASCMFTVIVNDVEAPLASCPANIVTTNDVGQCGANVSFAVTGSDNCAGVNVVSVPASGSFFPIGATPVMITATDAAGNTNACTFTVTVNDMEAPSITCPANIVTTNDAGQCGAVVSFSVGGSDGCSETSIVSTPASGSTFPVGVTTVTNVITDSAGNSNVCTFTVTVNDVEAPTITCPANMIVGIETNLTEGPVSFTVSYTDNCTANVVSTPASGSNFALGTNLVNSVVTDASGNTNECSFEIVIHRRPTPGTDKLSTVINKSANAPLPKLLANDSDADGDTFSITSVSATSTNGGTVVLGAQFVTYTPVNGYIGDDEFTYTLTDSRGATNTGYVQVTVRPPNPGNNLVAVTAKPSGRVIRFAGIPGQQYVIEKADTSTGPWTPLSPPLTAGATGVVEFVDGEMPPPATRFYRTILVP